MAVIDEAREALNTTDRIYSSGEWRRLVAGLLADAERLDWYEQQHTLHLGLTLLYVVDGYNLALEHENGKVVYEVHGETLREAIDAARSQPAK